MTISSIECLGIIISELFSACAITTTCNSLRNMGRSRLAYLRVLSNVKGKGRISQNM